MNRTLDRRDLCHENLGRRFDQALSDYDTGRRVEVLIDDFLSDDMVIGKRALDVGCGLGFFSERLRARGALVTACDIGPTLLEQTRRRVGCEVERADALQLIDHFGAERFDLVVSSECIEHTPSPNEALRQMAGVLKSGGTLAVSTPNLVWSPVVRLATALRLRPFDGYENFSTWRGMKTTLEEAGVEVEREYGLHLIPFHLKQHRLSRWLDRRAQWARGCMINICLLGRKR